VPTKIGFEPDPAGERTIVEIETLSGPDVLRRITLAFAAESVEILLARCNREADRADNVFYVPRLNLERRETLRQRLREYLGADRGVG
jgi:UTP:GlnB (protein PII) uridylyltransferase